MADYDYLATDYIPDYIITPEDDQLSNTTLNNKDFRLVHETDKAILIQTNKKIVSLHISIPKETLIWLPKSQIFVDYDKGITLSEWAENKLEDTYPRT